MKHIIKNDLNINKEDIEDEVTRIKVLLVNSHNQILVGYSHNCYQFIGGHKEKDEPLVDCLNREVLEEVGIFLNVSDVSPYLLLEHYCNDWPEMLEYINCKIYYFVIHTDLLPNLDKTKYTKEELEGNFKYEYIDIDKFRDSIINNYLKYDEAKTIGMEMLMAFDIFMEDYNESINY